MFGAVSIGMLTTCVRAQSPSESQERAQAPSETEQSNAIDLAPLTCRDFLKTDGEERTNLMIFMHGYMSGKAGNTKSGKQRQEIT